MKTFHFNAETIMNLVCQLSSHTLPQGNIE